MRRVSFTATLRLSRRLPNERPHLTKRSFVRHAFSDLPQSRRVTVGVIRDKKTHAHDPRSRLHPACHRDQLRDRIHRSPRMPIAVIGVVLLAMPHASLVGHVPQTNWSNMDSRLSLRAQQTILANEWWCAQPEPGRNASLACRRYTLRRLYAASAESQARTEVRMQISEMVMDASEATLSAMRSDTKEMLRQFCSIESNALLEVCTSASSDAAAGRPNRRRMHSKNRRLGRGGGGGKRGSGRGNGRGNGRKGMAQLWTPETLQWLRTWWCAERTHAREPRCSRSVRWTRQQPGLSAMRRLYCASSERGGAHVAKLCLGAPGVAPAVVGLSRSERRTTLPALAKNAAALVHGRPRRWLRPGTASKLIIALLVLAGASFGWMISRAWARRAARAKAAAAVPPQRTHACWFFFLSPSRSRAVVGPSRAVDPAHVLVAEEFVVGAPCARKRSKRARTGSPALLAAEGQLHQLSDISGQLK